jgi:hypothetical protein
VTALFEAEPCTVAASCSVPLVTEEAVEGETLTAVIPEGCPGVVAIVTVATADLVGSATLVAMIIPVPPVAGAVNMPAPVMLPIVAVHVTELLAAVPWIAAVNCTLALGAGVAAAGETAIELTGELDGLDDAPTPTHPDAQSIVEASETNNTRTRDSRSRFITSLFFPKFSFLVRCSLPGG